MGKIFCLIWIFFSLLIAKGQTGESYVLSEATAIFKLSSELNEISGLSSVSDSLLLGVQDELGTLYFLNQQGQVVHKYFFGEDGDYEGVAAVGDRYYVLRSNGDLFCIASGEVMSYHFGRDGTFDFEGLCYDRRHHRLLVACKSYPGKRNDHVMIYGFDLSSNQWLKEAVYKIKKDASHARFKPSACAVHPNGCLYVLSSVSKQLMVLGTEQQIVRTYHLEADLFNQPEGLTFFSNGDLYVCNEKRHSFPRLLKFKVVE